MTTNPFTYGNPIRTSDRFFGRTEELRQIVNRLRSSAHESTSIVGERRIGKTSLLKHLDNKSVAESLGLSSNEYCIIYMDFQGLTDITPERFWQRILQKMERAVCLPEIISEIKALRNQQTFDLFDLEDLFATIADSGLTMVLLMDEFEYVTQNTNFGPDFFGGLRTLAIHHNLPLITATRRELVDLCHSDELKGSPFFNIFANIVLRPFHKNDVDQLVQGYLNNSGVVFNEQENEMIWKLGGGYPFFTQMAANFMFEGKIKKLEGKTLLLDVIRNFDTQSDPHYQYMWSHTSESQKITILTVIALNRQKTSSKTVPVIENIAVNYSRAHLDVPELVKHGLLIENKQSNTYNILSPSLERWIAHEILAAPGEEESQTTLNEWLKSGGKENLEPVIGFMPKFKKKYWPVIANFSKEISMELIGGVAFEILTKGLF